MKRWIALMAALMLLLTACGTEPADKTYDLVYDLLNYEDIVRFEKNKYICH